ncbi:MAG: tryptophan synthase subunit alpha [Candidatus Wallbacteria bacterium]|nr:tryptophan synthase subunit alpha [Candidatus Wallbacteria bacterium]
MSLLTDALRLAVARGDRAFIPFLAAGFPDQETSERALRAVAVAGADAVEIGIPYSDSLADGPVVQGAYHRAIERGQTLSRTLEMVGRLTRDGFPPVILMVAYNVIFRVGLSRFAALARAAGASAVLPPDLPVEEWCALAGALAEHGLDGIRLVAPTTTQERLPAIVGSATGFVYYISRKGVTGVQSELPEGLEEAVRRVRAASPVPVAVGFGISSPEQAAAVGRAADGLVVGSALVKALDSPADPIGRVRALATGLRVALTGLGPLPPSTP